MANKNINARVALKHDTEENWITAGEHDFCPMAGEVIIYDIEEGVCSQLRYKIGRKDRNGQLININDLPFESNVYVGRDEPVNAPVGFIWVDTSDDVKLITFYLDIYDTEAYKNNTILESKECIAEEGMTFRDWVSSPYNTEHWTCMGFNPYFGYPEEGDETEEDHAYGTGRVCYEDGSYGSQEDPGDGRRYVWWEWLVSKKKEPTWRLSIIEGDFIDCESNIIDNGHYWTMHYDN